MREAVRAGLLSSAHDVAEGGLAIAIAECCLAGGIGAQIELREDFWEATSPAAAPHPSATGVPEHVAAALFGEGHGGFVVSGDADALRDLGERVPLRIIGRVGEDLLTIVEAGAGAGEMIAVPLDELAAAHGALAELFS